MLKRNPQHKNRVKENRLKVEDKKEEEEEEEIEIGEDEEDTPAKGNSMMKSLHKGVTFAKEAAMLRRIVGFEESCNVTIARDLVIYKKIFESRQISKQASRKRSKEEEKVKRKVVLIDVQQQKSASEIGNNGQELAPSSPSLTQPSSPTCSPSSSSSSSSSSPTLTPRK
ncbi:hypothetical protein F0562_025966 [Nyssa sinensis]|uniref:Uncharacterized protein n=1 Tax=Nyssa sinensis TaxID=561372 RepID=A0A5J5B9G7_9ASTE|nr:hypothetical protein F0562_025966 [Nyssa sinensis]